MIELSITQVNYLTREINKAGLTYSHLREDLTDHVCCDVEYEMQQGFSFEQAYERVKQKIGLEGLIRVQHDTLFLIDKNYRIMKKTMKITGLIAPIILALSALFKMQHWPGAGILIVLGFFVLAFFFLPSAIYVSFKEVSNSSRKWNHIIAFLGTFLMSLSFLFKIMHWPGAGVAMLVGIMFICLVFLPSYLISKLKEESKVPKYVYVFFALGLAIYLLGFLFKMMHWSGAHMLFVLGGVMVLLIALPVYVYRIYKDETHIQNSFIFLVIATSWFFIPTMLMSRTLSIDVIRPMLNNASYLEQEKDFLQKKNNFLYKNLKTSQQLDQIIKTSDDFMKYIQHMKAEMVKIGPDGMSMVDEDNNIYYDRVYFYSDDISGENFAAAVNNPKGEFCKKITDFNKSLPEKDKIKVPHLDNHNLPLIAALNTLSLIQIEVLEAQQKALIATRGQNSIPQLATLKK